MQFAKNFIITFTLVTLGALIATYYHPYEQCKRQYDNAEEIVECVWLLQN